MFCHALEAKGEDVFQEVCSLKKSGCLGTMCVETTDGAPAMLSEQSLMRSLQWNAIKASALSTRLFWLLCQDFDEQQENLLYHTEAREPALPH